MRQLEASWGTKEESQSNYAAWELDTYPMEEEWGEKGVGNSWAFLLGSEVVNVGMSSNGNIKLAQENT